jgi:hypothetical protein
MEIQIPYGSNILEGVLPEEARTLTINEPELRLTPEYFKETLHNHLRKNTLDLTDTVVVVADKTRVCGYPTYLPLLVEVLEES